MTVINIGTPSASVINNSDSQQRKTQGTSTSAFQIQIPEEVDHVNLNPVECRILDHALQFGLPDTPDIRKQLIKAVKKSNRTNIDEATLTSEVISILFDELEKNNRSSTPHPLPVHGCSERPESSPNLSCPSAAVSPIHTNFEKENSDYQKAIQASLMESSISMRPFKAAAPENPSELLRDPDLPVGMHNIGQTCWFSVIAQILYHIPQFRRVVYESNVHNSAPSNETCETHVLKTLRELFACMDSSLQRYLDPEPMLRVLSACNKVYERNSGELIGHQQDVVEMLLRLVDWLEKALQKTSTANPITLDTSVSGAQQIDFDKMEVLPCLPQNSATINNADTEAASSAMETSHTAEAENADNTSNTPQFKEPHLPSSSSAYWLESPLRNIFHTTLVETGHGGESSLQHQSMLMLILDLDYEDLHSAFEHQNLLGDKQVHYSALPSVLFVNLKRFQYDHHTGQSHKVNKHFHFPPTLYLDRYLDKNSDLVNKLLHDRKGYENQLALMRAQLNGYREFPVGNTCAPLTDILAASSNFIGGSSFSASANKILPVIPQSENNATLRDVLGRLSAEIAQKEAELRVIEEKLMNMIGATFIREDLLKHEYHLRAVVIHEGDLNSGHYWAYILKNHNGSNVWLKMNDRSVDLSSWDEIVHEAYGSKTATSAYCMVYVRADAESFEEKCALPEDLMQFVTDHNLQLQARIFEYSEKQASQETRELPKLLTPIHDPINLPFHLCQQSIGEVQNLEQMKSRCDRYENIVSRTLPKGVNNEMARKTSLEMQMHALKQRIDRLCLDSELFSNNYNPQTVLENIDAGKVNQLYQSIISRWYEYPPSEKVVPAERLRFSYDDCDPLHFWRLTDIGMPSWLHRYIICKAMESSLNFKEFSRIATEELTAFDMAHSTFPDAILCKYRFVLVLYQIVKDIWFLLLHIMDGMQKPQAVFSGDNINEFSSTWQDLFNSAYYITFMYDDIAVEIGVLKGAQLDFAAVNRCIGPNIVVRAVFSLSLLQLYAVVIECLISERSIEELYNLLDGNIQHIMMAATNKLVKYASQRCRPSEKISSCLTEMLSISQTFPAVQNCSRKSVILQDFIDSTDPTRDVECRFEGYPICHSYDMPQTVHKVTLRRTEVGFADEKDIETTLDRLCTEIIAKIFSHSS